MVAEEIFHRLIDGCLEVRLRAIEELARRDDPDALACLVESLADPEPAVREAALAALRQATGLDLGDDREGWREWWKARAGLVCLRCGKRLFTDRLYYLARLQLTSEPRGLYFTAADLKPLSAQQLQEAADDLATLDPAEAQDEVYVRLKAYLCLPCKLDLVREARHRGAEDED